jgi:hypothetical protein
VTKSKATVKTLQAIGPARQPGELKPIGGSGSDTSNTLLANQVARCLSTIGFTEEQRNSQFDATISGLIGISPPDEIEGMLAAQLIAAHVATMECYRRAVFPEQTFQGQRSTQSGEQALSHLHRTRGSSQPPPRQGTAKGHRGACTRSRRRPGSGRLSRTSSGPGEANSEDQPHAKQLTHPQQALRCANEEREALPVAGDAERPLPDARRTVARTTKR